MQYKNTAAVLAALAAAGAILAAGMPAPARAATETEPLALRKIMQELGAHMQTVAGAISREDWELVARLAPRIAEHPEPPVAEKLQILSFVGADAGKFKGYDQQAHQAATTLETAARRADGKAVIAAYASVQNACMACHQGFRKPLVEHFYRQR